MRWKFVNILFVNISIDWGTHCMRAEQGEGRGKVEACKRIFRHH